MHVEVDRAICFQLRALPLQTHIYNQIPARLLLHLSRQFFVLKIF